MGFFDSIGDFFQENIIDPVKKIAKPVIETIGSAGKVLGPAAFAIPGVGPIIGGVTQAAGYVSDFLNMSGSGPGSPAAPTTVPWQAGGTAPTVPPSLGGAFQAHQAAQTPNFLPMQTGGYAPGAGGYSPMTGGNIFSLTQPSVPFVNKATQNPWLGATTNQCICCPVHGPPAAVSAPLSAVRSSAQRLVSRRHY